MSRKNSFANDLIKAPCWVSLILAGIAYLIHNILPGITSSSLSVTMIVGISRGIMPVAIIFFLVTTLLSFISGFKKPGSQAKPSPPRKQSRLTDELILGPWWISLVLAGIVYLASLIIPSISSSSMGMTLVLTVASRAAPWFTIFLIFIAFLSFIRGFKTRAQLKRQKSVDTLNELSWKDFENVTGELFRQRGYRVEEMLGGGADGGVDLRLRKSGQLTLVQCKRWKKKKVGLPVIRELLGAITAESAEKGILVTTSTFTSDAVTFAQQQEIQLINGTQLSQKIADLHQNNTPEPVAETPQLAARATPLPEQPTTTSPTCPICNLPMKLRTARRGANSGNQFWGCTTYPKCRGIINL